MMTVVPIKPLLPGATLGVLGGGQLGRMFSQAASSMGYRVCVLDPAAASPAAEVSAKHIQADYDDEEALAELAACCHAVTTEFENVPADSLRFLQQKVLVSPPPEAVEIAQDRIKEKTFFKTSGLPVNSFVEVLTATDIDAAFAQMNGKAILKTAQFGYDGKGQAVCETAKDVHAAFESFSGVPCILEDFVAFDLEVSVVLARDIHGHTVTYPVVENQHKNGILDVCVVPARVPVSVCKAAQEVATELAEALDYIGVLAVEMFVIDDQIALNEIAPRPHNSGHYTMDACNASQFVQQVRTLCGLPVASVSLHQPVVMYNLLGDSILTDGFSWQALQKIENAHLHVYGKGEARVGRKMGHVNFLCGDTAAGLDTLAKAKIAAGLV